MSNLSSLKNQHKVDLGEIIYVLNGSNTSDGSTTSTVLGDFVKFDTSLSTTTYNALYSALGKQIPDISTVRTSGTTRSFYSIHYDNNLFVAGASGGSVFTSTNAITWTERTNILSASAIVERVHYADGIWVAVGSTGRISSSTDAITWTIRVEGTHNLYGLSYGTGLWVAGGNGNTLLSSTNAITWTTRTSNMSTSSTIRSVNYINNLWVYTGIGSIGTSTDGITWTNRVFSNNTVGITWWNIAYGDGVWVLPASTYLWTSTDLISISIADTSASSNTLGAVHYADGVFVAGASSGRIFTSTNGKTWVNSVSGLSNNINAVTYSQNTDTWVAVGSVGLIVTNPSTVTSFTVAGTDNIATSVPDVSFTDTGTIDPYIKYLNTNYSNLPVGSLFRNYVSTSTVTAVNSNYVKANSVYQQSQYPELFNILGKVATTPWIPKVSTTTLNINTANYFNNLWVYAGDQGLLATSTNIDTWTVNTSNTTSNINTINFANGTWIYGTEKPAISYSNGILATATNINSWNIQNLPGYLTGARLNSVQYLNNKFVIIPESSGDILISTDGSVWNAATNILGGNSVNKIHYANGLWVAAGTAGALATSTDLITWTARTSNSAFNINVLNYLNGLWIYVNSTEYIGTSTDAITWTSSNTGVPSLKIAYGALQETKDYLLGYGNGRWLRTRKDNGTENATSTDGLSWQIGSAFSSNVIQGIHYANGTWVAVGSSGYIRTSTDGITWTTRTSNVTGTLSAVYYANGLWVCGGTNGILSTSTDAITWTGYTTPNTVNTVDSSSSNKAFTVTGYYGILSTVQKKFGNTSLVVGSVGNSADSINFGSNADFGYGTGDFTIEGFIYTVAKDTFSNKDVIFDQRTGTSDPKILIFVSSTGVSVAVGNTLLMNNLGTITLNTWHHVALTRSAGVLRLFIDGVKVSSDLSDSTDLGTASALVIGRDHSSEFQYHFKGYIDEVRITKGIARYINNFTVTTAPFPNSVAEGDTDFANVSLLLHMEELATIPLGSGTRRDITSIAYGNGTWNLTTEGTVATSNLNNLATSTNGTNWKSYIFNNDFPNFYSTYYANGIFVIAGNNGKLATSTNAVNWVERSVTTTDTIRVLHYGNGLWMHAGDTGFIETSTDAITWSTQPRGSTSSISSIYYANGTWMLNQQGSRVKLSSDGINWNKIVPYGFYPTNVQYVGGLWVFSITQASQAMGVVVTSTDLNSWSLAETHGPNNKEVGSVFTSYSNNLFISGEPNTGKIRTSTNGITWTVRDTTTTSYSINFATYQNNLWLIGGKSRYLATSTDAITWTTRTTDGDVSQFNNYGSAAYGENTWLLLDDTYPSNNKTFIRTSTNALDWIPSVPQSISVKKVYYGNGLWLYAGSYGTLRTSTDGITWTWRDSKTVNTINNIHYANGLFVYAANTGVYGTSTDGITWTSTFFGSTFNFTGLHYANNLWVMTGGTASIVTSTDAITWTSRTSGMTVATDNIIYSVDYNNGTWVYVGTGGTIGTSTDGITWTINKSGTSNTIKAVKYANQSWVYAGNNGVLATSTNVLVANYSPLYNIQTEFYVPNVTINDSANSVFFIKAKSNE